jgi:hypothetical protein
VDTIRLTARQRHFYTADVELEGYGRVMLVGDQEAVERFLAVLGEHKNHTLKLLPPLEPPAAPQDS